jgi:translocator assembly and maintenance protein 41
MALRYAVSRQFPCHMRLLTLQQQQRGGLQCTRYLGISSRSRPIEPFFHPARRFLASQSTKDAGTTQPSPSEAPTQSPSSEFFKSEGTLKPSPTAIPPSDWEDNVNFAISQFSELPHSNFGVNQHIVINDEFKEALRQILWQFRAPIRYAFAYGSGVFPQSKPVRECSVRVRDNQPWT